MKHYSMLLIPCMALLFACQDNSKIKTGETVTAEKIGDASPEPECYRYVKNRDTISLSLQQTNQIVTGELAYNFFEKDKSRGKVSGIKNGDTLLLVYNFEAEGTTSEREVIFLQKGNKLIQGFGAEVQKDGAVIFKDKKQLRYDENGVALTKTACDEGT